MFLSISAVKRLRWFVTGFIFLAYPSVAWEAYERKDPLTDVFTIGVVTSAVSTTLTPDRRAPDNSTLADLFVQCEGGEIFIAYRIAGKLVSSPSMAEVIYRFDSDKHVVGKGWRSARDRTGFSLVGRQPVSQFLREAKGKSRLLFRTRAPVFGQSESVFDLTGLLNAVEPVVKACRLKLP